MALGTTGLSEPSGSRSATDSIRAVKMSGRKIKTSFVLAFVLVMLIAGASYLAVERLIEYADSTNHDAEFLKRVEDVQALVTDLETASRGYVITGDENFLQPYHAAAAKIDSQLSELARQSNNREWEREQAAQLAQLAKARAGQAEKVVGLRRSQGAEAAAGVIAQGEGNQLQARIRELVSRIGAEQAQRAKAQRAGTDRVITSVRIVIIGGVLLALVIMILAIIVDVKGKRGHRADITARNEAEAKLRESDERLQTVIENMAEGLVLSDLKGQLLHWNPAALRLHGFDKAADWRQKVSEFTTTFELKTMDGRVLPFSEWPMSRLYRGEEVRGEEIRIRRLDTDWHRVFVYNGSTVTEPSGKRLAFLTISDVTKQRESALALKASEERLRLITDLVPHGIFAKDAKGRYIFANRALAENYGRPVEEILGTDGFSLVADPAQAEAYRVDDREVIATGKAKFIPEELNTNLQGKTRVLQTTKVPFTVPETGEAAVLGVWVDITEQTRAKEALRRSEHTLAETERISGIGSFNWDLATGIAVWSPNMFRLLGIDPAIPDSQKQEEFTTRVLHPDDRPHLNAAVQHALDTGGKFEVEYRIIKRDGSIRNINAHGSIQRGGSGKPERFLGWIQDVTEHKQAQADLRESENFNREILDSLNAHIAVLDKRGTAVTVNEAWRKFAEENNGQLVQGGIGHDYLAACERISKEGGDEAFSAALRGIREVMGGGLDYFGLEYPCYSQGEQRWFQLHVSPLTTRSNAVVTAHEDITERRMAEEEVRQLNVDLERRVTVRTAELEAANKELEAFSYSVSHDLRSPLRAIDGFSQAVLEDYRTVLPAAAQEDLLVIRQGAQRMGVLIDDLLTFSRLSRSEMKGRSVDMQALVDTVLDDLRYQREGREVKVQCGKLPCCWGDAALLKQVWTNLISNALKYSKNRKPAVVEIGAEGKAEENVYYVRDNGTGFDMRYADKLFGVFQRLHRAEDFEGTGVGLAIVQRVIHRHGGRVWADAKPDQGAAFYFTIPNSEHHECS